MLEKCPDPRYISRNNRLDERGSEEEQRKKFQTESLRSSNYDVFLYDLKLLDNLPLLSKLVVIFLVKNITAFKTNFLASEDVERNTETFRIWT